MKGNGKMTNEMEKVDKSIEMEIFTKEIEKMMLLMGKERIGTVMEPIILEVG